MALSNIAAGLEVTTKQRDRGIAAVDNTKTDTATRLSDLDDELPCDAETAATVLESHTTGRSVGESARAAGVAPVTAAKTLYLLGVDGVNPLTPQARAVLRDWLNAELSRSDAKTLTGAGETEFALATFIETHDPIDGASEIVEASLTPRRDATVQKRDHLAETMSGVGELR